MSTVKSKKLQVGTDATSSNNFTIYQPSTPDGTLRIGVGNADSPTEIGRFDSNGYVATNAPAFSAHNGGNQSITANTDTKVAFPSEDFDTDSCFDTSTYIFTPNVAGYYQLNCTLYQSGASGAYWYMRYYKNGSFWVEGFRRTQTGQSAHSSSTLVYANGTTDNFQVNVYSSGSGLSLGASNAGFMRFSGFLVKAV